MTQTHKYPVIETLQPSVSGMDTKGSVKFLLVNSNVYESLCKIAIRH
jgi:hypothetical protein